jgi:hypothetical protein
MALATARLSPRKRCSTDTGAAIVTSKMKKKKSKREDAAT